MKMNQKGQEAAPFELMVAVVLMTFVIVMGLQAIEVLNRTACEGNMLKNMEHIKTSIESVVKNKSKANTYFELPDCFNEQESSLRIIERDDITYCSAFCGGSQAQCTILQFSSPTFTEVKCVNISSATTFPDASTCNPAILDGDYSVSEWKTNPILEGQYTLIREFNLYSDAPIVCVYQRN